MFIRVNEFTPYIEESRDQLRLRFNYAFNNYDLPITDINFDRAYRTNNNILNSAPLLHLTISLGIAFEDFHYKLIAGVIYPQ